MAGTGVVIETGAMSENDARHDQSTEFEPVVRMIRQIGGNSALSSADLGRAEIRRGGVAPDCFICATGFSLLALS